MAKGPDGLDGRDGAAANDFFPAFEVIEPKTLATPIVFNSPHSGAVYPARFLAASRLDALTLRRSEDAFVDELFTPCVEIGAPLMRAHFPRAYLDVNREPFELDPQMFDGRLPAYANTRSLRVAGGLGTIPRVVGEAQPIYRAPLPVVEALGRISQLYRPYHETLRLLVERAAQWFGLAVLIDCHSMPSGSGEALAPDFVIGDRFGASCAPHIVETIERALQGAGYRVRRNKPYAGGFITEHYGAPSQARHVVQIEINRALYMNEKTMVKREAFEPVREDLAAMAMNLARRLAQDAQSPRLAAE